MHCEKKNVPLSRPTGEMVGLIRKRFLLYPDTEIANFQQKDRDNSNAHSVFMYIMLKGQPMLYPFMLYIFQCENIVSFAHFCKAFGDA